MNDPGDAGGGSSPVSSKSSRPASPSGWVCILVGVSQCAPAIILFIYTDARRGGRAWAGDRAPLYGTRPVCTTWHPGLPTRVSTQPYAPSARDLAPYEDGWDSIEEHLLGDRATRTGWFSREELEERYGGEFVGALDAEASRLLGAHNSTIRRMADERFPAEELAEASALLSVLFRRWREGERLTEKAVEERGEGLSKPP